ncbi:hypothetical protein CKAH01_03937 [Colletotrichum kahawae]|uniref:Uncharacterized protein n=1 Tax=Colletotrichum kahawae TaxID=34407 RepID=A0AAE0DD80_COLKA|nr:hypothetical protein CKAH01_03937 [Colletotrichum kahawae]
MSALTETPRPVVRTPSLPSYSSATELQSSATVNLTELSPSTRVSNLPPTYVDATAYSLSNSSVRPPPNTPFSRSSGSYPSRAGEHFTPTVQFQIESSGKQLLSLPRGTRPDPIPVFRVEDGHWNCSTPAYRSLRFSRRDNSSILIRGGDAAQMPVCTTLYRFGPGKPPVFRLRNEKSSLHGSAAVAETCEEDSDVQIRSKSLTSRTQILKSLHGIFRWRYASRKERTAVEGADTLLVCELVQQAVPADGMKTEEKASRVAQLVRGEKTRTPGTGRSTAGNGGRLMMDLFRWTDLKDGAKDSVEWLIVASCICMLKKEIDRRRMQQIMAIGAGVAVVA